MTSLLEFYQKHGISPVRQDITNLSAHFQRRAHLYRSLGLPPSAITNKTVLEIGAGSGENALYTASLKPFLYTALEPNPVGAAALRERFKRSELHVVEQSIGHGLGIFSVVLCEGLLGLSGSDPAALLEQVADYVRPGGVLVITCIDPISDCAEVLRRAMAYPLIRSVHNLMDQVAVLRPVFAPHLATLKGMTRSVDDWLLDNLLNPASIGPTISVPDACAQLEGRFEVLGCSPRFLLDGRWYKDATPGNQWAIDAYWTMAHNLYDYRTWSGPQSEASNRELMAYCVRIRAEVAALERGEIPALSSKVLVDPGWFGRGQQYLSFVRV